MKRSRGFTLIEIIIFIVLMIVMSLGLFMGLDLSLRGAPDVTKMNQAILMAQQRMEVVLGQRYMNGFASFTDPCGAGPYPDVLCAEGAYALGYTINTTITPNWSGDPDLKSVSVSVTGPAAYTLTTIVGNY